MAPPNTAVRIQIIAWVDDSEPGFVRGALTDAWGKVWTFVDKVPAITMGDIDARSAYPQPGLIACEVVRRWRDAQGRQIIAVGTEHPWDVWAESGETQFDVLPEQMTSW